jgi:hypothetical protein
VTVPNWVYKRDGSLVPFEADRISRALFAATERLGRPDAFLAREMTDGIVHFLAADASGIPTTEQIAELVVKVVRELGQPELARAFAEGRADRDADRGEPSTLTLSSVESPYELAWRLAGAALKDFSLQEVFARDLAAAHADGLLTLGNLDSPRELAGCVLGPAGAADVGERIEQARALAGQFVVVDGPEFTLGSADESADYLRQLDRGLRISGLQAVVNLNCPSPPAWAEAPPDGPLFVSLPRAALPVEAIRDALAERLLAGPLAGVRLDWHLQARDFVGEALPRLQRLARRWLEGAPLAFVFDRPGRPVALAEGIDRRHPATLMSVGLHLRRLVELLAELEPQRILSRLGSLVRLALSAGVQKRDFLRRAADPRVSQGFLLDRARLVLVPLGLVAAAEAVDPLDRDLDCRVLRRLQQILAEEPGRRLEAVIDSPVEVRRWPSGWPAVAGVTAWEPRAAPRLQLAASGRLHALTEAGTALLVLPADPAPSAEQLVELLRYAWEQTALVRVQAGRLEPAAPQLLLP